VHVWHRNHLRRGLATGADVASITLVNSQPRSLVANDPASGAARSLNLTVGPAALDSFTLAPSDTSPVAGNAITVGLTALDQYQNIDTNYTGSQCVALSGTYNAPDGTGAGVPGPGSCTSGGSQVNFVAGIASGVNPPSITLADSEPVDLMATDVPSGHFGSTTINVTPGLLHTFAVVPDSTTETAGTAFNVRLTALDEYQNVDTNFTGAQCVTFSGPDHAPNAAILKYPVPRRACATGSSAVTFASGYLDGPKILSVTMFDAETANLSATLTTATQTGSVKMTGESPRTRPPCCPAQGGVGPINYSSTGESASSGNVLTALIHLRINTEMRPSMPPLTPS